MSSEQDLDQGEFYYSESLGERQEIRLMPVPHALRALAKLERQNGYDVLSTPLGKALLARAAQGVDAEATEVEGYGGRKMLRDRGTGQFKGAWAKSPSKKRRAG